MPTTPQLIVLEGLDGSGKSTQFDRLSAALDVKPISFPDYTSPSSSLVKMYLSGAFSANAAEVNAYAASSFYAVDRYASYKLFWEADYLAGKPVLAARYTTSNAIYQMVKLAREQWDAYLHWLEEYEYTKLALPKPTLVLFLDMPVEVSQKLLSARYQGDEGKKDIHEADIAFLAQCREAALYAAKKFGWTVIPCAENGLPLAVEQITETILKIIKTSVAL
ncbi:MAG: deoxynucleoside kinase [Oscillospiraceae bacterium]